MCALLQFVSAIAQLTQCFAVLHRKPVLSECDTCHFGYADLSEGGRRPRRAGPRTQLVCKLFTAAEVSKYVGKTVENGKNAARGNGCQSRAIKQCPNSALAMPEPGSIRIRRPTNGRLDRRSHPRQSKHQRNARQTQAKRSGPIDAGKFLDGICEAICSAWATRQASATMVDGHEGYGNRAHTNIRAALRCRRHGARRLHIKDTWGELQLAADFSRPLDTVYFVS